MKDAIDFEVHLVNFSTDDQSRRDPDHTNNPYQLWQLRELFPHVSCYRQLSSFFQLVSALCSIPEKMISNSGNGSGKFELTRFSLRSVNVLK